MPSNYRAHLQTAAYLGLGMVAVLAGWAGPTDLPWWEHLPVTPQTWWHLVTLAAMGTVMLLKVQRPTLALLLGAACVAADLSFGFNAGILICLTDLIYSHGVRAPARRAKAAERVLGVVVILVTAAAVLFNTLLTGISMLLLATAVLMVPLWWAAEVRRGYPAFVEDQIRQRLEEERHRELLAEQQRRRSAAIDSERRRMARELHDVVSSQVASIALTSGAVLNADPDHERDRRALQTIRGTSVETMDQLRQMVQMLRSQGQEDDAAAELLTAVTWEQVLAQAHRQGLELEVRGAPPSQLGPAVQSVLLRILQESLTNAARHGAGTAEVWLRTGRRKLVLTVESALDEEEREAVVEGTGTGLIAMEERAQSIGGSVSAGEHRGRWRVQAQLPLGRDWTIHKEEG